MFCGRLLAVCFGFLTTIHAAPNIHQLYQFSNTTRRHIENIAIRPNDHLVLTMMTEPVIYTLDPLAREPTTATLHRFDNATGVGAITEVAPDIFAVVVGNYSVREFKGVPGSFSVWLVNLTSDSPVVKKIASLPEAETLNGITTASAEVILVADAQVGAVYGVNINTGSYQIAIQDPQFMPNGISPYPIGINGIHKEGEALYFTNTDRGTFGKLFITSQGTAAGNTSIIANAPTGYFYDDFCLDSAGIPWVTAHHSAIMTFTAGLVTQFMAVNSTEIVQPTACVFGNPRNISTMFVVTGGRVTNSQIINGQVLAITGI